MNTIDVDHRKKNVVIKYTRVCAFVVCLVFQYIQTRVSWNNWKRTQGG